MERKLTKKQIERNERDEAIRSRYQDYMSVGSSATAVYEALAEEFHVSTSTVFYVINGYPTTRKRKRRTSLRKTSKAIN